MPKTYTVSELSRILGVSVNTTWKKINKVGLTTSKEVVNNREITVVILSDDEYRTLITEKENASFINNPVNNGVYEDSLSHHGRYEDPKVSNSSADMVQIIESIMNYSKDMNNQVKEYVDRVINAEKQVKLLEDVEHRKESEFLSIKAKCKELEAANESMASEIELFRSKAEQLEKTNLELQSKLNELEKLNQKKKSWFHLS